MKIIKKGKINTIVTCDFCECEYEFDRTDIKKESSSVYNINTYTTNNYEYKYVECPCCGHKQYLQKPQRFYKDDIIRSISVVDNITTTVDDIIHETDGVETKVDNIIHKTYEEESKNEN